MIRLQFVDERWPFYRFITWGTRGDVCHVDAILPDGRLLGARPFVIKPGVQIRPADYHTFTRKIVVDISCSAEQEEAFYAFLNAKIGTPYDFLALLGFVFNRKWQTEGASICSGIIVVGLQLFSVIARLYDDPDQVAPADLLLVLSALPNVTIHHMN